MFRNGVHSLEERHLPGLGHSSNLFHESFSDNHLPLKPIKQLKLECLSAKGPPPTCQQKVKHLQFDIGMTLTLR